MNKALKMMISLGTAVAAAKAVKTFTDFELSDMLGYVGLEKSRSHIWEKMAFFGMGALAGAGAGVLLAPYSGRETRKKLGEGMDKLATKASDAIAEVREQAPELLEKVTGHTGTGTHHRTPITTGNQGMR